jgi:hypothetical protein
VPPDARETRATAGASRHRLQQIVGGALGLTRTRPKRWAFTRVTRDTASTSSVPTVHAFGRTYNQHWLIERHGYRTPAEAREHVRAKAAAAA